MSRRHRNVLWSLLPLFLGIGPCRAAADAVSMIDDCPIGAAPGVVLHGPYCRVRSCETDEECGPEVGQERDDLVCRSAWTCQERQQVTGRDMAGTEHRREVLIGHGPCATDETCEVGVCVAASVCVPQTFDPARPNAPVPPPGGCGCGQRSPAAVIAVPLGILVVLGATIGRGRR